MSLQKFEGSTFKVAISNLFIYVVFLSLKKDINQFMVIRYLRTFK